VTGRLRRAEIESNEGSYRAATIVPVRDVERPSSSLTVTSTTTSSSGGLLPAASNPDTRIPARGNGVAKSQHKDINTARLEAFFAGPLEWTLFDEEDAPSLTFRRARPAPPHAQGRRYRGAMTSRPPM